MTIVVACMYNPLLRNFWNKLLSSKLINLSFYMQGALARDFGISIESYYKFDSNNVNPNYTHEVNKNSTYCTLWQLEL